MIKVKIFSNNLGEIFQVESKGHAEFDEYGKDIVCAAVSVVMINTINALEKLVGIGDCLKYSQNDGDLFFTIDINGLGGRKHDTQLLLKSLVLALESIEEDYYEYIKITHWGGVESC